MFKGTDVGMADEGTSSGSDSDILSKRCGVALAATIAELFCKSALARLAMVSVQAEKFGGEDTHHIGFVNGIPINFGSPTRDGNNAPSLCVSSGLSHRR